jgi:hypothetical protein
LFINMARYTVSALMVAGGTMLSSYTYSAAAFVAPSSVVVARESKLDATSLDDQPVVRLKEIDESKPKLPRRTMSTMSQAIPFLRRPSVLTGELAGDFGFDPLGLAKNEETLLVYREAEIKHGRLAMLAAAGWPVSELLDRQLADYLGAPSVLVEGDRVPSVLNGGLENVVPEWWGFCLGMCAAIDLYGVQKARAAGKDSGYIPGDLGWDPLGLYPTDEAGRNKMQLAEIKHARVAMLGVTGFAVQEYVSRLGVIDETPFFFYPLSRTISEFLSSAN